MPVKIEIPSICLGYVCSILAPFWTIITSLWPQDSVHVTKFVRSQVTSKILVAIICGGNDGDENED